MLPTAHRPSYEAFQHTLLQVQALLSRANPDVRAVQEAFLEAQQLFQIQIVSLDWALLDSESVTRVQSVHTEINKQLRMLGMDVVFLQTARQSLTVQKRQAQMGDRLTLLLNYCEMLLADDNGGEH